MIRIPASPCVLCGNKSKGPPHAEDLVLAGAGTGTASSHCRGPGNVRSVPKDRAEQEEVDERTAGKSPVLSVSDHLAEWDGGPRQPWARGCRMMPEEEGVGEGPRLEGSERRQVPAKSERSKD